MPCRLSGQPPSQQCGSRLPWIAIGRVGCRCFFLGPVRTTEDSLAAQVVSERRFFASRRVLRPSDGDNGAQVPGDSPTSINSHGNKINSAWIRSSRLAKAGGDARVGWPGWVRFLTTTVGSSTTRDGVSHVDTRDFSFCIWKNEESTGCDFVYHWLMSTFKQ